MKPIHRDSFSDRDKVYIYRLFGGRCNDCGRGLVGHWHEGGAYNHPKQTFTIEQGRCHHIIPFYHGGNHKPDNWMLLCIPCHNRRHKQWGHTDNEKRQYARLITLLPSCRDCLYV